MGILKAFRGVRHAFRGVSSLVKKTAGEVIQLGKGGYKALVPKKLRNMVKNTLEDAGDLAGEGVDAYMRQFGVQNSRNWIKRASHVIGSQLDAETWTRYLNKVGVPPAISNFTAEAVHLGLTFTQPSFLVAEASLHAADAYVQKDLTRVAIDALSAAAVSRLSTQANVLKKAASDQLRVVSQGIRAEASAMITPLVSLAANETLQSTVGAALQVAQSLENVDRRLNAAEGVYSDLFGRSEASSGQAMDGLREGSFEPNAQDRSVLNRQREIGKYNEMLASQMAEASGVKNAHASNKEFVPFAEEHGMQEEEIRAILAMASAQTDASARRARPGSVPIVTPF